MSRFSTYEQDRKANQAARSNAAQTKAIAEWLAANPEIGQLSSGKFYKIVDGRQVFVKFEGEAA